MANESNHKPSLEIKGTGGNPNIIAKNAIQLLRDRGDNVKANTLAHLVRNVKSTQEIIEHVKRFVNLH